MKHTFTFLFLLFSVTILAQDTLRVYQKGFNKKTEFVINMKGGQVVVSASESLIFELEGNITEPVFGSITLKSGKYSGFYIEPGATKVIVNKRGFPTNTEVPGSKSQEVYNAVKHAKNGKAFSAAVIKYKNNPIALEQFDATFKFKKLTIEDLKNIYAQLSDESKEQVPLLTAFLNTYEQSKIVVGSHMYDFTAEDRNGNIYSTQDYRGEYILLDFASTGCGPCWAGYPDMIEITSQYNNLQVLTYNEDNHIEGWVNFAKERDIRLEWPVLWYGKDKAEVFELYNVEGWPLMFLISPDGIVLDSWYGSTKGLITNALKKHIN